MSTKGISLRTLRFRVFILMFCKDNEIDKVFGLLDEVNNHYWRIFWHMPEDEFQVFKLLEQLGEGNKPTTIIGEIISIIEALYQPKMKQSGEFHQ